MSNQLGVHIFYQSKSLNYEEEIISFSLLSAISWKKHMGPIILYCNKTYLETIKKYNVDSIYDDINSDFLEDLPNGINYGDFWAFYKLLVAKKIQNLTPFTILDTDLWLNAPLIINQKLDVMMYHNEKFDINYPNNPYPDFDQFLPDNIKEMKLDKEVLPTNCAILHIRNNSFINKWVDLSTQIALHSSKIEFPELNTSSKMCFIEQRLLPMVLKKENLNWDTFLYTSYLTHIHSSEDGSEWEPNPFTIPEADKTIFENIKHVWGLKSLFSNSKLKFLFMRLVMEHFQNHDMENKPYSDFFHSLKKRYVRSFQYTP